jgi:hypothetical protein
MRTTMTLDDDVAAALAALAKKRKASFRVIVNDLLRAGLTACEKRKPASRAHRTTGFNLGPSLIGSLDNIEEAIARAEGESHR